MSRNTPSGLRFVQRMYPPRIFGMAVGFPAIGAALYETSAPWHFWLFLVFLSFLWPHLAYRMASSAGDRVKAEYRNLMCDSAMVGLCVPMVSYSLLPSVAVLAMIGMANMSVGGWNQFLKGLLASLGGLVFSALWVNWIWPDAQPQLAASLLIIAGSTPVLIAFPVAIGLINFGLSRRLYKQREQLEKISRTDDLSQLSNRRFWEDCVFSEFERHKRSGSPLSMVMLDIDHFKQVNDQFGHVAGDQMIREISDLLSANARHADVVGRYGGEEFGVLLPDTELDGAMQCAERIRLSVQTLNVKPYGIRCTVSLGVAEVSSDMERYSELVERADQALYDSKRQGRNISLPYTKG